MKTHYLIINTKHGTWGRGETMDEAIERCRFTVSQDEVRVYVTDPDASVVHLGEVANKYAAYLGTGRVMADKKRVAMTLEGEAKPINSVASVAMEEIQRVLDGHKWSADTPEEVADILRWAGYQVRETAE